MLMRRAKRRHDMFGNPLEGRDRPPGVSAARASGAGEQLSSDRRQRPIPPGLVPWLVPAGIVLTVVVMAVAPFVVVLALLLVICVAIGLVRSRSNRGRGYYEMRREDPLYRDLDDYRRGRGYRGLDRDR